MQIFDHTNELHDALGEERLAKRSVGFVPTMGALHKGHLSLVKKAVAENDTVVVSIFVNPTQFDNQQDFDKYPEDFERDITLLKTASDNIIVFAPKKAEIYNGEITSKTFEFKGLEKVMEGAFRNGHFNGVATIVELLLNAVKANRAYFGEKDFQQLQIIRALVAQKEMPVEIIGCPIEREPNGLARSSRNERLSKTTRTKAGFIYEVLNTAKKKFGMESAGYIKDWVSENFAQQQLFKLEYFEIADVKTLTPITKKQKNKKYRAFIAVYAEEVRLIDNIALN
ncbi:pantoate--beta-alanine ligase [uncultured Croceitalea sp.]|uniref:pantoate--beta-alanine ligase n=1 Tax=uncultured Croceitalea sp. TaxID=1798908 RepID=UPI0033066CB2